MTATERTLVFDCGGQPLVGIVSEPARPCDVGVVVVVGGPQYRAGSHRQFVLLARALADAGHAVLRFDVRGMGDAAGPLRTFEDIDDDIAAAIAALRRAVPAVQRVVLWGLCDGASAALMYWHSHRDGDLAGLCLANPWVRSPTSQARTQVRHYYTQRLREGAFWRKLLSGQVAWSALGGLLRSLAKALRPEAAAAADALPYQGRMALAWRDFPGPILLLLSGQDYVAKEFLDATAGDPRWAGALSRPGLSRCDLAQADHTFSTIEDRRAAERATCQWLTQALAPAAMPPSTPPGGRP